MTASLMNYERQAQSAYPVEQCVRSAADHYAKTSMQGWHDADFLSVIPF